MMFFFGSVKKTTSLPEILIRSLFDLNGSPVARYFSNGLKTPTIWVFP